MKIRYCALLKKKKEERKKTRFRLLNPGALYKPVHDTITHDPPFQTRTGGISTAGKRWLDCLGAQAQVSRGATTVSVSYRGWRQSPAVWYAKSFHFHFLAPLGLGKFVSWWPALHVHDQTSAQRDVTQNPLPSLVNMAVDGTAQLVTCHPCVHGRPNG